MILLPERWIGTVTVVADVSASQWQFIKYTGNLNDRSVELLRVGWATVNDFPDRFENRIELAQKGIYQYYGYIPPTEEKELRIDQEELLEMFVLL